MHLLDSRALTNELLRQFIWLASHNVSRRSICWYNAICLYTTPMSKLVDDLSVQVQAWCVGGTAEGL